MFPRKEIKANARAALSAHYWPVVGILFLGAFLASILCLIGVVPLYVSMFRAAMSGMYGYTPTFSGSSFVFILIGFLVAIVVEVGIARFAYSVYRGDEPEFGDLFAGFRDGNFGRVIGGMLLMTVKLLLWSLLLYFPLFIKAYEYSMLPYLLIDRPDLSIKECFKMSKKMTKGHKWHLFVLDLSFLGWAILGSITAGILDIFFVIPYMTLAQAGAYDFLKRTRMEDTTEQTVEGTYTEN